MDNGQAAGTVHAQVIEHMMDVYGTSVLRMCYAYLSDYALAEDAAQDTFIKAYRKINSFLGTYEMSEKAWLMRIAINTFKDYKRSAWFRHVDRSVTAEDLAVHKPSADFAENSLMEAILTLPVKLKEVVLLFYYQGLKYKINSIILFTSNHTASRIRPRYVTNRIISVAISVRIAFHLPCFLWLYCMVISEL